MIEPVKRQNVYLVCGGNYHDFDYVRLELLKHLHNLPHVRTQVGTDYSDIESIRSADALLTYTTDVLPNELQQSMLDEFVNTGKRWFALHGTNAVIDIDEKGIAHIPRVAPQFMELLGSQFIAHPPKGEFKVSNSNPDHPLVKGIAPFVVDDELYIVEQRAKIEVLLHAHFNGKAMRGFAEREFFSSEPRPIMYLRHKGEGSVLYLNLGHARGHVDMSPLMEWYPKVERCSWLVPEFHQLLERGVSWMLDHNVESATGVLP